MSYTDENGVTAFVQQDDLFEWGGFEMVRFYKDILRGHLRTLDIWVKQGLIKI